MADIVVYPISLFVGRQSSVHDAFGNEAFYEYYQIGRDCESAETETEPKGKGELRTVYEHSHSLFGYIWQIATSTGWSLEYILNGVNYQTLLVMLADAPRYVRKKDRPELSEEEQMIQYYQSQMK